MHVGQAVIAALKAIRQLGVFHTEQVEHRRVQIVDVHSTAIASAANIGGAASAPVVAAYHRQSLVPVSILMALIGYAMGNYLAIITGQLAHWVSG